MTSQSELESFFHLLYGGASEYACTTICMIDADGSMKPIRAFPLTAKGLREMQQCAASCRKLPVNVFLRPSALWKPPTDGGRGKEADTAGSMVLHADIDIYKAQVSVDKAMERLYDGTLVPAPSCVVNSGGGLHAYWRLNAFCRDNLSMKGRNRWLQKQLAPLGADSVADLARLLRVPGTFNQKYIPPVEATILALHESCVYSLADFGYVPPPAAKPVVEVAQVEADMPNDVLVRMARAVKALDKEHGTTHGMVFDMRLKGSCVFDNGNQSERDYNLLCTLAWWTRCNPQQMRDIFMQSGCVREKTLRPTSGSTYLDITIDKVIDECTSYRPWIYRPPTKVTLLSGGRKIA